MRFCGYLAVVSMFAWTGGTAKRDVEKDRRSVLGEKPGRKIRERNGGENLLWEMKRSLLSLASARLQSDILPAVEPLSTTL